ncbi:MAG TPA: glycine--tRNA ligase subunit beta [Verrucomicrobiae bacterium]|nr:glycine--tRNA ligase subunit beta [Verrucomicrobiae bacterium]
MARKAAAKSAATSADLLVELGCEDLPARFVSPLAEAFARGFTEGLAKRSVMAGEVRSFATPRRLAVLVENVALRQPDRAVERKGPKLIASLKDGQPTQAGLGFAKSCGVEFAALAQEDGQLVFRSQQLGRPTAELVTEIFEETLKSMDELVPKRMRWGSSDETFVRPVQWLVAMLGPREVPLLRFGLKSGSVTYGHRFHAPKPIALGAPADYVEKLRSAHVVAGLSERQAQIRKLIEVEAARLKGTARITDSLLAEVAALVEWPVVISGRMEERFMALPAEVIIATIETNQRYFPVFGRDGKLLPLFITVTNLRSKDVRQVIAGNERVVRPRLTDALFFWEQDRRRRLADFLPELDRVTFQKELGSVGDKARRVSKLVTHIAAELGIDALEAERAAKLAKADLVSRMVFEIPELQGLMGGHYARASGESNAVAQAVAEQYLPAQAGTPIPASAAGRILALADRLDTLAGIFAIGQKPSASKDPFALRRAALGALRICLESPLPLDLRALLKAALEHQPAGKRDDKMLGELWDFVLERLRGLLADRGIAVEVFNAVAATGSSVPADFAARVDAVRAFGEMKEAAQLAAAHKRIRNILKQAGEGDIEVKADAFREPQEKALYEALTRLDDKVHAAVRKADYTGGLRTLAQLQAPVDAFFDKVMVMAPEAELRANRIALLRRLDKLCRGVADISCLPGGSS